MKITTHYPYLECVINAIIGNIGPLVAAKSLPVAENTCGTNNKIFV